MYPTPPKVLSATRAHRKGKEEKKWELSFSLFFWESPPLLLPFSLSLSFSVLPTHCPHHRARQHTPPGNNGRERGKTKGKGGRTRVRRGGGLRRNCFGPPPPPSLSLFISALPTHHHHHRTRQHTHGVCFFVSIQLKSRKNMSSQARQFCPKSFLVHFLLFHLRF